MSFNLQIFYYSGIVFSVKHVLDVKDNLFLTNSGDDCISIVNASSIIKMKNIVGQGMESGTTHPACSHADKQAKIYKIATIS